MSLMTPYERAYALAVVRNPHLTADQWERIALDMVGGAK